MVLGLVALASVTLSFALVALTLLSQRRVPESTPVAHEQHEDAAAVMSRVIADVERLAVLRERGALTAKEFTEQKAKLLAPPAPVRSRR